MKQLIIASLLLPASLLAEPAAEYVNFIRQVQHDTGLEWDISVLPEGEALSPTGASEEGSLFELWSIHSESVSEYLLDEQYVSPYTPQTEVEIVTADPYALVPRTRVDQPFQVRIKVAGLVESSDSRYSQAPTAAKEVAYTHTTVTFPEGAHSLDAVPDPTGLIYQEGSIEGNADAKITFPVANLSAPDLTKAAGEEIFTITALSDYGVTSSVLDSKRVQIWPIAEGGFSGYDPDTFYETVPSISMTLVDLYPSSTTYVRTYPGPSSATPVDAITIGPSHVIIEDSVPQHRTVVLKGLDRILEKHGLHTLEILHETPFGIDLLHSASVLVDRDVQVVATIYSGH